MNLEKEMRFYALDKKRLTINIKLALRLSKMYAEEMCFEQKNLCAEEYFKTFNLKDTFVKGMVKIRNAPLATESK